MVVSHSAENTRRTASNRKYTTDTHLPNSLLFRHEVGDKGQRILLAHVMESAHFALMTDSVALIRHSHQLWAEGTDNELRGIVLAVCLFLDQIGNRSSVSRVQSLVL